MIPQSFIQELLDRVDIVDIVGRYVQLKKGGANFLGLCPFHNEKSPSFTVSPTKQFFHCFGCGAHGSAIGFMMDHGGLGYVEAVEELARTAGLTVPHEERRPGRVESVEQKARAVTLGECMTRAGNYYRKQLRGSARAIDYLKSRGLSGEIAARFGLGYAPDDWQNLEAEFGRYAQDGVAGPLLECGLLIESEKTDEAGRSRRYDRFRDRVMFPIRNTRGQVIGFGGRVLGAGEPKYLNSPETPLFSKGNELYGLFEARQAIRDSGFVLVTEGYMDVVALAQHGFANAVATLGTACTPVHVQKLMRQTDRVVFAFDGDTAGRKAARRAMDAALAHLDDNKHVSFLFLPAEHDPDSFVRAFGAEGFTREIGGAMPLSRFLLKSITEARDLREPEERARALFDARPLLQAMPAGALRLQIVRELGEATGHAPAEVERLCELRKAVASRAAPARVKRQPPTGLDQQVLRLLMRFPQLAARIPVEVRAIVGDPAQPHGELLADLLRQCESTDGSPGFAAFHESLMRSPHAEAYEAQRPSVMQDERGEDEAGVELDSAIMKIVLRGLEAEQTALAARIERGEASLAELEQYRLNAQHIRELKAGGA